MLKKTLIGLILVIILIIAGVTYMMSSKRELIRPYPYAVMDYQIDDLAKAEEAIVLIIGDRMGKALDKEIPMMKDATQLNIYNWAKSEEGLHRTLYKLNKLKKVPPIIIYHGASEELFEKKFSNADMKSIEKNLATSTDDKLISLIITFPILSKIFYKKMEYIDLPSQIIENKTLLSSEEKLNQKYISFKFFAEEIKDLVEFARRHKSKLIFITTPINYEVSPKETCSHSETETTQEVQLEIEKLISEGQFKEAYAQASKLSEVTTANAKSFFLLGKAARGMGDAKTSRNSFQKATAFDCQNWRGNAVYNSIMLRSAIANQIALIDFDLQLSVVQEKDQIFFDELYPQNIFYQSLAKDLSETIMRIYNSLK